MAQMITSARTAKTLALVLFLIGLAILTYANAWWPGIMLAIGLPIAFRQYLVGRRYDMYVSLFVFIGVFVTVQFNIAWEVILPILFSLGAIYIFFREFIESRTRTEAENEEELNAEIEEDTKNKKTR